jgi:hypothetical protein
MDGKRMYTKYYFPSLGRYLPIAAINLWQLESRWNAEFALG